MTLSPSPTSPFNVLPSTRTASGGHVGAGVDGPRTTWWFAEGYTAAGFDQYFAILNPTDTPADIVITYYLGAGAPVTRSMMAPPLARCTIAVHLPVHGVGRNQEVAAKIESMNGVGIIVERAMYFRYPFPPATPALIDPALIPEDEQIFVGLGGQETFVAVGQWFLTSFIDLARLCPDERVLDVGCGIGRIAVSLATYLNGQARYAGFDIVGDGIDWCQRTITPRYSNFEFIHADVHNVRYNPAGRIPAAAYTFPYEDDSFDFAFATSVFTHMFPRDVTRYLGEIARVLRPGGRCLLTFFLHDLATRPLLPTNPPSFDFGHAGDGYRTTTPDNPEAAIAFSESMVRSLMSDCGLRIVEPIRYGTWAGHGDGYTLQDVIIAVK